MFLNDNLTRRIKETTRKVAGKMGAALWQCPISAEIPPNLTSMVLAPNPIPDTACSLFLIPPQDHIE